jgi:PAS domain S-box-containing protein
MGFVEFVRGAEQPAPSGSDSGAASTTPNALKQLVELSPDALLVIDDHGGIVEASAAVATLFGYTLEELLGQPVERLLPERVRGRHVAHRSAYLVQPHTRPMGIGLDLVGRRADGAEFPVDISLRPCRIKGLLYVIAAIRDVSAQRALERDRAELLRRLQRQSELINLAHDAILVRDLANRVLEWNRGAEELYGWSAQEAIGQVTHILFKTRFPSSLATIQAELERDGQWEGELIHIRPDGRTVVVESRWALIRGDEGHPSAILEINRDITERRRAEALEASAQATTLAQLAFLQQLLDALPNGVYVVHGHEARLVLANRAAVSTWGAVWQVEQSMQDFLEQHHIQLTDAQGRSLPPEERATIRAVHGETVLQAQQVIHRPQGDALPILLNAIPLTFSYWQQLELSATPTGAETNRASAPISGGAHEPLALAIQQDVHVLKEAEYLKDEFITLAAHELRTPVTALKAAISTLQTQTRQGHGPQLADWQQEMLQEVDLATDRLTDLTDDLLDVTRLQAGLIRLYLIPTNLVALVHRVVRRLQPTTTNHQMSVQVDAPSSSTRRTGRARKSAPAEHTGDGELIAMVDGTRIEQVLLNLLSNAIKYSPDGGSIAIRMARRAAEGEVELQLQDHGIGIPHEQQRLIFGRFVRADNAREAEIAGTGLGLYISRGLVEQHGGRIWFESQEGKGTTFFVTLPLTTTQSAHGAP